MCDNENGQEFVRNVQADFALAEDDGRPYGGTKKNEKDQEVDHFRAGGLLAGAFCLE